MLVIPFVILIEVMLLHSYNACSGILVIVLLSVMLVRLLQPLNALLAMLFTLSGITKSPVLVCGQRISSDMSFE